MARKKNKSGTGSTGTVAIYLPVTTTNFTSQSENATDDKELESQFLRRFVQLSIGDPVIHEVELPTEDEKCTDKKDQKANKKANKANPKQRSKEGESKSPEPSFEFDDEYLRSLDPSEWKEFDHYKVLGLKTKRHRATQEEIKLAYRQIVLKHHPDKRKVPLEEQETDYFPGIVKSFEILSDPKKRMAYDSVDPEFDDSIPSRSKVVAPEDFLSTFGPVFERNAYWSKKKKIPSLGDDKSTYDDLMTFYKFWMNFESWRDYSYLDEEEKEKGADRDERRYLDKINKMERQKRKNAEIARIRMLADTAMLYDYRLKKRKDEELKKKQEMKMRYKHEQEFGGQENRDSVEKKKKEELAKKQQEKLENDRLKKERDAARKAKNAQKQLLIQVVKQNEYFMDEKNKEKNLFKKQEDAIVYWLEGLDTVTINLSLESLQKLNAKVMSCGKDKLKIQTLLKQTIDEENNVDCEKNKEQLQEQQKVLQDQSNKSKSVPNGEVSQPSSNSEWTTEEIQCLVKALQMLPPGTEKRWQAIANFINNHVHGSKEVRTSKQVITKAKNLQNITSTPDAASENQQIKTQIAQKSAANFTAKPNVPNGDSKMEPAINGTKELNGNVNNNNNDIEEDRANNNISTSPQKEKADPIESQATAVPTERIDQDMNLWSAKDQKLLEAALKNYPADTDQRWDKIAAAVPGKSRKECMKRYKEIVELLKAKKSVASK